VSVTSKVPLFRTVNISGIRGVITVVNLTEETTHK